MNTHQITWLDEAELIKLSKEQENEFIEKTRSIDIKKIAKTICAFSNDLSNRRKVAVMFIGITDDGKYTHRSFTDKMQLQVTNIKNSGSLLPFPVIRVQTLSINQYKILAIQVQPSENPPMRYDNRCWVRIGPSVQLASEQDEKILLEKRQAGNLPEDMKEIFNANIEDDLNMDFYKTQYLPSAVSNEVFSANNRERKTQMRSLRLLGPQFKPTMTAILLLGKNPRYWFPGAYIQFIRFDGKTLTDPVKNQLEISGALQDQILQIEEVLKANISTSLELSEKQNIQSPDYPMEALKQLIRNAVIHRDYTSHTPTKVHWFSDRIEIQSPGGPYGELNTSNFGKEGLIDYRNPNIAAALKNLNFVERFGFGIPQSKKALEENGNPALELQAELSTILAVIRKT